MLIDMVESHKVVVDTNVLISAIVYGGKPRIITSLIIRGIIKAYISPDILAEVFRVLKQKFLLTTEELLFIELKIKKNFKIIYPTKKISVLADEPDNRIIEAAWEGKCQYIITGDKELLNLKIYKSIEIINVDHFLDLIRFSS